MSVGLLEEQQHMAAHGRRQFYIKLFVARR
jgi:hypothetical protein